MKKSRRLDPRSLKLNDLQTDLRCLDAHAHLADLEGTVDDVSKDSKTVAVKTADGTKESFVVADHAVVNTGKDVGRYSAQGANTSEHVTVYYTEEAGKKIAHVFKHL